MLVSADAAPAREKAKASALVDIGATAGLQHLLSTLQGRCYHRHMQDSLPAGWLAFTGRESNPLDRDERFPSCYISSPFPGFILTLPTFHTRASHWSHAVFMPVATQTVGRHPLSSIPGQQLEPGFDDIPTLSTRQQRFTHVRLTSTHLTDLVRLFRNAHHPSHCAGAACGGLNPDPATRVRGAHPHLLCSKAAQSWSYIATSSSRRRGARSSA